MVSTEEMRVSEPHGSREAGTGGLERVYPVNLPQQAPSQPQCFAWFSLGLLLLVQCRPLALIAGETRKDIAVIAGPGGR